MLYRSTLKKKNQSFFCWDQLDEYFLFCNSGSIIRQRSFFRKQPSWHAQDTLQTLASLMTCCRHQMMQVKEKMTFVSLLLSSCIHSNQWSCHHSVTFLLHGFVDLSFSLFTQTSLSFRQTCRQMNYLLCLPYIIYLSLRPTDNRWVSLPTYCRWGILSGYRWLLGTIASQTTLHIITQT